MSRASAKMTIFSAAHEFSLLLVSQMFGTPGSLNDRKFQDTENHGQGEQYALPEAYT